MGYFIMYEFFFIHKAYLLGSGSNFLIMMLIRIFSFKTPPCPGDRHQLIGSNINSYI